MGGGGGGRGGIRHNWLHTQYRKTHYVCTCIVYTQNNYKPYPNVMQWDEIVHCSPLLADEKSLQGMDMEQCAFHIHVGIPNHSTKPALLTTIISMVSFRVGGANASWPLGISPKFMYAYFHI